MPTHGIQNFGTYPFDTELSDNEQDDTQEYVPINQPPPSKFQKTVGEPR